MNNAIWFFDNIDVFQILCPHSYKNFADNHVFNNFNKGDFIYFEEDSANKIYLISSGKVKIGYNTESGDEVITSILSKGQIFGEKAILGEDKREEFAQAIENGTSICVISLDMMYEMLRQNNDFSLKIYKFIGYRFKKLERRLQLLLFKDAKTRLLEFIKDLGDEYGYNNIVSGDRVIRHPYTQKEIATLIGTSRPTLNILLNELQKDNILIFQRKEIILKK
jgi:CRP/FNR family cyclic AMP-dependent transcriptional regulator